MEPEIHAYLRIVNARERESERVGPFLATFGRTAHPYSNYAIPDDGAEPTAADVEALTQAFRRRGRRPRLEYLPAAVPAVERALVAGGYVREDRLTVMALSPKELRPVAVPAGFELLEPESDEEILGLKGAQNEAYGDPPPDASTVAAERAFRASGGLSVLARSADGEPAGGGGCTAPEAGLRELAGVGVRARALSPAGPGTGDRLVAAGAGLRTGHEPSLADARGSGGGAHLPRPQDPCFGGRAPRPPRPLRQRVQRGGTCGAGKTHPGRGRGGDEG